MTQQSTGSAADVGESTASDGAGVGAGGSTDTTGPDTGPDVGPDADLPPVPDDIRAAGRRAPDHWLGVVDPGWSGSERPPPWATLGRWRSGLDGEIVEWEENPDYRPSPLSLGWPEPEDEVDRAVQLASTGYGPGEAVPAALVGREIAVLTGPGGSPLSAATPEGTPVVPVFTSPVFLHAAGHLAFELVGVADLVPRIPEGHAFYLNSSATVSMVLDVDAVRDAIRSGTEGGTEGGTEDGTEDRTEVREFSGERQDGARRQPVRVLTEAVRPVRGTDI